MIRFAVNIYRPFATFIFPPRVCSPLALLQSQDDGLLASRHLQGREVAMASTRRDYADDPWPNEPSVDASIRHGRVKYKRPSFGSRVFRTLIIFGLGIGATLGWQSYGDAAREMIVSTYPQLDWLAPQAAALAQTASDAAVPTASAMPVRDPQQLEASLGLAAVRKSVDQLAMQVAASQQQLAGDIARLQAAQQDMMEKISAPAPKPAAAPAPARKPPVALTPPPQAAPPVR
jgi:hypothetical protein